MVLARHSLTAKKTEPAKIPAPSRLMLFASAIAVLSAAAVFLFLLLREQRTPILADTAGSHGAAGVNSASKRIPVNAQMRASAMPKADGIDFETFNFSLARSRSYRAIGPIRLRLLRTDKSDSCDIAILMHGRRTKKSRIKPGDAIAIAIPGSVPDARMVVTRIAKNEIWGYLVTPKTTSKSVAEAARRERR